MRKTEIVKKSKNDEKSVEIEHKMGDVAILDSRTYEYRARLNSLFKGGIFLLGEYSYKGPENKIPHECTVCGNRWDVMPRTLLKGGGCPRCGFTSTTATCVHKYKEDLKIKHPNLVLYLDPPLKFTLNYKQLHFCTKCSSRVYEVPNRILAQTYNCPGCRIYERGTQKALNLEYRHRLKRMYGTDIFTSAQYRRVAEMEHCCSKGHTWMAKASDTLLGSGCPSCSNSVPKVHIQHSIYGRVFYLKNKFEIKALTWLIKNLSTYIVSLKEVRECLVYPIPPLDIHLSKRSLTLYYLPSFYSAESGTYLDVLSKKRFTKNLKKWIRLSIKYEERYRIIVVDGDNVEMLSEKWYEKITEKKSGLVV